MFLSFQRIYVMIFGMEESKQPQKIRRCEGKIENLFAS